MKKQSLKNLRKCIKKYKITTPDYFPYMGGLSTYTQCLEKALTSLDIEHEVVHWKNRAQINKTSCDDTILLNVNYLFGFLNRSKFTKNVNFIHGSEILFYSKNVIIRMVKILFKKRILKYFESSHRNIFISEFTLNKLKSFGYKPDFQRDIVFHNCIDTILAKFVDNRISKEIIFCCIVRDVPHKNISGTIELLEKIASEFLDKNIILYLNNSKYTSEKITIKSELNLTDDRREEIYSMCHFNLLLSLDSSDKGFFEGFGLTCLEAGKYGTPSIVSSTGGLPENVHHLFNGLVFDGDFSTFCESLKFSLSEYEKLRHRTFDHTCKSHSLKEFENFIDKAVL